MLADVFTVTPLTKHNGFASATNDVASCYTGITGIGPVSVVKCSTRANAVCVTVSCEKGTFISDNI